MPRFSLWCAPVPFLVFFFCFLLRPTRAQENPYIVTYDQFLEEPRNLEIEYFSTYGTQRGGNDFHAFWLELRTVRPRGGQQNSIWTRRPRFTTARYLVVFAGRIAFVLNE